MSMAQNLQELTSYFEEARMRGLCATQKEFASLCGVAESTMSMALGGADRALTDKFMGRVRLAMRQYGLIQSPAGQSAAVVVEESKAPVSTASGGSVSAINKGGGEQKILGTPSEDVRHIVDRFMDEVAAQRLLTQQAMDQVSSLVQTISNLSNKN